MAQYKTGTVSVVQNSNVVTGDGTAWLLNISAGNSFIVAGTGVIYDVAAVISDTELHLSVPYAGSDRGGAQYAVHRDFTPDGIPEMAQGDIETAAIFTRAMRRLQTLVAGAQAMAEGTGIFPTVEAGEQGTQDGEFFSVPGPTGTYLTLYQNQNGTAAQIDEYPNRQTLQGAVEALAGYERRILNLIQSLHGPFPALRMDFENDSFVVQVV